MLISRRDGELFLVHQVDHGVLCGEFVKQWGGGGFAAPEPYESVLTAAVFHDEGWRDPDLQPLFNAEERRPLHFLEIALDDHIPLYRRGVHAIAERDPYAGLLLGMHWSGLYRSRWGLQGSPVGLLSEERSAIQQLQDGVVAEEEQRWGREKEALGYGAGRRAGFEASLWHNYELLQAWDVFSLFVSVMDLSDAAGDGEPQPVTATLKSIDQTLSHKLVQHVPVAAGGDVVDITLRLEGPGLVSVDPYPFKEQTFDVTVAATAIPDVAYAGVDEAGAALADGRAVQLSCTFQAA